MTTDDTILDGQQVMAILRNLPPAEAVARATTAWDLGLELVEVPIQTEEFVPSLRAVVAAGRERGRCVGAGTVTSPDQVTLAESLGCAFTVAPGLDAAVVRASHQVGLPHVPGVASASEIQRALRLGSGWLKAFPASALGTKWFRLMRGPFPNVKLVATGGIDAANAADFLKAGADMVAVGSALTDPCQLESLAELMPKFPRN